MKTEISHKASTFPVSHLPTSKEWGSGKVNSKENLTIPEALLALSRIGKVWLVGEHIRVQLPHPNLRSKVENALAFIQQNREEAIKFLKQHELPTSTVSMVEGGKVEVARSQQDNSTFPVSRAPISGSSTETDLAMDLLNEAGARILPEHALAIPEGKLSTEIRWAIRALGMQDLELVLIPTKEVAC